MALVALSRVWPENLSSSEVLAPLLPDPDAFPLDKDMDGALDVGVAAKAILRKQTRLKKRLFFGEQNHRGRLE